ncbi:MAG: hypothetical protein JWP89_2064 [Schlesneria sp.]|nr:hypothetical protein [Schlesneria sp.]
MLASPFLTRWYCLWQVPDVALPFDEAEFLRGEEVAEEDDAYVNYHAAIRSVVANGSKWVATGKSTADVWSAIEEALNNQDQPRDPQVDQWVRDNGETLHQYRLGGEKPLAKGPAFRTMDANTLLTAHNDLRKLAQLARIQGLICEAGGDIDTAWQWHRANLQCARHAETPKIAICRFVGMAVRSQASYGIVRWSESSAVTAGHLRSARKDVQIEAARRTVQSDCSFGEYLVGRNTLNRKDAPNHLLPAWNRGLTADPAWLPLKRIGLWFVGQPEVTLRLQRQLLLNNCNSINLPLYRRAAAIPCDAAVVIETRESLARGQLEPRALASVQTNSPWRLGEYAPSVSMPMLDESIRREDARLFALTILLACQEYYRDHAEFPAAIKDLVPDYLDAIPFDPMLATAVPMQYRRDTDGNAVVWSVGQNQIDDGGDVNALGRLDKDTGYRIVSPLVRMPSALEPVNILRR